MADVIDPKKIKEQEEALKKVADIYNVTVKEAKKLLKEQKDLTKEFSKTIKSVSNISRELGKASNNVEDMNDTIRKLNLDGALKTDKAIKLHKQLQDIQEDIFNISKMKGPLDPVELAHQRAMVADLNSRINETQKAVEDAQQESKKFSDIMEESGPNFLKGWAGSSKGVSKHLKNYGTLANKTGEGMAKWPGLLKHAGTAAKGLGGALGKFAGPLGMIVTGVKALWDLGMAADKFVKDANKSFGYLRGPDIMTGDVKKQFIEFNKNIYDIGKNLEVGLDAVQIREFMEAVSQAGMNIQNLNTGLMTYRDAIYVAAKGSKILGIAVTQAGNMMEQMMMDFRMDLGQVDKSFVQVAFDAKKSGLSTDKFWQTVQNASSNLALYGVNVSAASKTVKAFTEDMIGGADDASKATENMFDVFKTGSRKTKAAIIQFAQKGGVDAGKMFEKLSKEWKGKAINIKANIEALEKKKEKTSEDVEELKKLRSQLYNAESKSSRYEKRMNQRSVYQADDLAALAGNSPEFFYAVIKAINQGTTAANLSGHQIAVTLDAMEQQFGLSHETTKMLLERANDTEILMKDLVGHSDTYFKSDIFKESRDKITEAIKKAADTNSPEDQIRATEELQNLLSKGMDPDLAKKFAAMFKASGDDAKNLAELLKNGDDKSLKAFKEILGSSEMTEKVTKSKFKDDEKAQDELNKNAEATFQGIVDQTLSFEDMKKIAEDGIKYNLASLGYAQKLNEGVFGILKYITHKDKKYMTEEQKIAQDEIKLQAGSYNSLKNLLYVNKRTGKIEEKSQADMTRQITKELINLETSMKPKKAAAETVAVAAVSGDPSKVIGDKIGDLNKTLLNPEISNEAKKEAQETITILKDMLEKMSQTKDIQDIVAKNQKDLLAGNTSSLGALMANASYSRESKNYIDDLIKIYKGEGTKEQKTVRTKVKIDEANKKSLEEASKQNADSLQKDEEQKIKLDSMDKNLKTINESNKTTALLAKYQLQDNDKYMKTLAEEAEKELARKPEITAPKLVEKLKMVGSPADAAETLAKAMNRKLLPGKMHFGAPGTGGQAKVKPEEEKRDILDVIKGGLVNVKKGDIVVDKASLANVIGGGVGAAVPTMPESKAMAATPKTPSQININVTATEKDLAQRIANEVRAVLYNQQLTGMA